MLMLNLTARFSEKYLRQALLLPVTTGDPDSFVDRLSTDARQPQFEAEPKCSMTGRR